MSRGERRFLGWRLGAIPVETGKRPLGTVTLADLGDEDVVAALVDNLAGAFEMGHREAALTVAHFAAAAVSSAVVSVIAFDAVSLRIDAENFGPVLAADAQLSVVWVGEAVAAESVWAAGHSVWTALSRVGDAVRKLAGIGAVAMDLVLYEAVELEVRRLERLHLPGPYEGWGSDVLDGLGFVPRIAVREVTTHADDGADITLPVRRVCCVLQRAPTEHACPSCPQYASDERELRTREWLQSLEGRDFAAVTGRPRVHATPVGHARRRARSVD